MRRHAICSLLQIASDFGPVNLINCLSATFPRGPTSFVHSALRFRSPLLSPLSLLAPLITMICGRLLAATALLALSQTQIDAFGAQRQIATSRPSTTASMFFAEEAAADETKEAIETNVAVAGGDDISVVPSSGDASSTRQAAAFMVDNFWLQSPQNLLASSDDPSEISDGAKTNLIEEQDKDLTGTYGEIMGKRMLESCLLTAKDAGGLLGLVGIESRLFDKSAMQILTAEKSQFMLKNAVASLGPKQRRQYKDSPASELVTELLPPELELVCCLSNLCTSPRARRRGVGMKLCKEAETIAMNDWGFDQVYLKVEKENEAARGLYEAKLGYNQVASETSAIGLRVDINEGSFVEQQHETLTLTK